MFFLEPFLSRRESSPSVTIPYNLFTQSYHFTLPLAYCFLCASVTCHPYLPPSQSVSAATSCFLASVENIKQHPSIQEIVLSSQILDKDSPYRVKDYQLPCPFFLAKKILHYKAQRRGDTLNSARHFASVIPTSARDFVHPHFSFCAALRKDEYLGSEERYWETITTTKGELKLLSA